METENSLGGKAFLELLESFLAGDFEVLEVADCEKVHVDVEGEIGGEL